MPFESINPYTVRRRHRFVAFAWPKAKRLLGQARRAAPGCASARMSWPA